MNAGGKNHRKFLKEILCLLFLSLMIQFILVNFGEIKWYIPLSYSGDTITHLYSIKELVDKDYSRLGWPFYTNSYNYHAVYDCIFRLAVWILSLFTHDIVVIENIVFFAIPIVSSLVCYIVTVHLISSQYISMGIALVYGFCPYMQWRLTVHPSLAALECIPLVFLLIFWLYEDADFNKTGRRWHRYGRNGIALLLTWLIANNGMVYYPFFACFLILITTICIGCRKHSCKAAIPGFLTICEIAGWLAIGFIPTLIGAINGVGNVAANGAARNASRASIYGLDIKSLLLPPGGWGIPKLKDTYDLLLNSSNENQYAYLGILGIAGFFILLLFILINRHDNKIYAINRLNLLSKLLLAMLLLATTNGLGVLVAVFIPFISCYNRISPFILFACLLGIGIFMDSFYQKITVHWKKNLFIIVTSILFGLCLWEQCTVYFEVNTEKQNAIESEFREDKSFFGLIEGLEDKGSIVFMLPYMKSFENGSIGSMFDYDHYKGYLHTNSIRWSYGAISGTPNDQWYFDTSTLSPDKLVIELVDKGISGVYVNLEGYSNEAGTELIDRLQIAANCEEPLWNTSHSKVYISLREYRPIEDGYSWFLINFMDSDPACYEQALNMAKEFRSEDTVIFRKVFDYINDADIDDTSFIKALYHILLHRECSNDEAEYWVKAMNNDRYSVYKAFLLSNEFKQKGL